MKKLALAMSLLVVAAMTFSVAYATSKGEPVNKKCPIAKKDINNMFETLNELIKRSLGARGPGEFVIPGLVKLRVRKKPATKDREVTMFGEKRIVKGKPASKSVKATPLKALKDLVLQ